MQKKPKWEYSEGCLNLYNSYENKERADFIAGAKKQEAQEIFNTAIEFKYDLYKEFLCENNMFLFSSLEHNIKESTYCLMIGAYTASITNTNLILEKAIKLALIHFVAGELINYKDEKLIEKYIESDKKYSGKNLEKNILACKTLEILNEKEADELIEYKIKYRDGFSHFAPRTILKGESSLFHIVGDLPNSNLNQYFKLSTHQAMEVLQFANNNAENHLRYILKIVNHLQYKVLEKFGGKKTAEN